MRRTALRKKPQSPLAIAHDNLWAAFDDPRTGQLDVFYVWDEDRPVREGRAEYLNGFLYARGAFQATSNL